jgi:Skp family chaperone for outer membrane proteins
MSNQTAAFRWFAGLCAAGLMAVGLASAAVAATPDPTAPVYGSVDLQKVQDASTKYADDQHKMQDMSNALETELKTQAASDMLSLTDQRQLGTLLAIATPTDDQKSQIAALQSKSAADEAELTTLQQKQAPTDADKARLNDLTAEQQAGQDALKQVQDDYQGQLQAEDGKLRNDLVDAIRQAVAAVAKEKGLTVVFDSNVAVYTPNDITADVIAKINK